MRTLNIATRGYLCSTLGVATRGYLCEEEVTINIPNQIFKNNGGGNKSNIKYPKWDTLIKQQQLLRDKLLEEDKEIMVILKVFLQCQ